MTLEQLSVPKVTKTPKTNVMMSKRHKSQLEEIHWPKVK